MCDADADLAITCESQIDALHISSGCGLLSQTVKIFAYLLSEYKCSCREVCIVRHIPQELFFAFLVLLYHNVLPSRDSAISLLQQSSRTD